MGNCTSDSGPTNEQKEEDELRRGPAERRKSDGEAAIESTTPTHARRETFHPPMHELHGGGGTTGASVINPLSVGPHSSRASSAATSTTVVNCSVDAVATRPSSQPRVSAVGDESVEPTEVITATTSESPRAARRLPSKNFRARPAAASFTSTVVRASIVGVGGPLRSSSGETSQPAGADLPDFDLGGPSRMGSTSASGPRNLSRTASEVSDGDDEVRRASTEMHSSSKDPAKDSRLNSTGLAALGTHTQSFVVHDSKLLLSHHHHHHHRGTSAEQSTSSRSRSSGAPKHQSGSSLVAPPSVTSTQIGGLGDDTASSDGSAGGSSTSRLMRPVPVADDNGLIPRGVPSFFGEASLRMAACEAAATADLALPQ